MPTAFIETSADQRRHARDESMARELVSTLERQAREIVEAAAATEQDDTVHGFKHYQAFRRKVGAFDSLCSVIESSLRKLAEAPRGALNELLHTRRDMILGPSIRAMNAFFTRLSDGGPLPFGLLDILEEELRALDSMREALDLAQPPGPDDAEVRAQIDALETIIRGLKGRATQFLDFTDPMAVSDLLPDEPPPGDAKGDRPPAEAAASAAPRDTPELRAVRDVRDLLEPERESHTLGQHAEIDLRALDDIERRLTQNPSDVSAAKWLRHLCNTWSSRLRGKEHVLLRIAKGIGQF